MTVLLGKLSKQAWMVAPETLRVMHALQANDGDARFVGGCVRDALVNRRVMDIDIATPLKPEEVIARLEADKITVVPTGLKHGTVTAVIDGSPFEITTLRRDVATYGRHADVDFTDDWRVDAARRDFTMNALSATIDGDVHDYFGGMEDLRIGRVAFIGDAEARIREDVLRILRFFRFYAHLGRGAADVAALAACEKMADQIPRLSAERVRTETLKLLESPRCADVWQLMMEHRIVTQFLPEATHVERLRRLVALEEKYHSPGFVMRRLAAVLEVTVQGVSDISHDLRLSNEQTQQLYAMLEPALDVHLRMTEKQTRAVVYRLGNDLVRSLLLLQAADKGQEENLAEIYTCATGFRAPRFPMLGDDVLALGIAAGPEVGRILANIEDWWVAQDFVPGRTACLKKLQTDYAQRA
ncbi:MAG: CCA tRNA nucleotidyltransferase [Bdellovibrionales bacterium]|jgi:poly(A) polymerase|nr:CCA tRNA nucleotidyltransferase [Bdellovibrionales bacterium]